MTSKAPLAGIAMAAVVATTVGGPAACARTDGAPQDDAPAGNPVVRDVYTADPAALVHDGRLYGFTGRDEGRRRRRTS
jgi:arabinoxylan arabinofuranohydrolase